MSLRDSFYHFIGIAVPREHQPRAQQLLESVLFKDEVTLVSRVKPITTGVTAGGPTTSKAILVTGTRNDNPALASLLGALSELGFITDGTIEV